MKNIRIIVFLYIHLIFCNSLDSVLTRDDTADGEKGRIQSVQLPSDMRPGSKSTALLRSRRNTAVLMLTKPFQSLLKETWHSYPRQIAAVYYDQNSSVVIYFDQLLIQTLSSTKNLSSQAIWFSENPHWIFNFTSNVWRHMTDTYGKFGPDPLLYLVVHHENNSKGMYREYSLKTTVTKRRINLLDINCTATGFHTNGSTTEMMTKLINGLSWYVEKSSKQRYGSPSESLWQINDTYTPFVDIFTYDVYKSLNMSYEAEEYRNKCLGNYDKGPKAHTFWLRDWLLPIYDKYGGNVVLNEYFGLLKEFIPLKTPGPDYKYQLSLGEFVHVWSGAAEDNLQPLADKAFSWDEVIEKEFQMARKTFPNITETYIYTNSIIKTSQTQKPNSQTNYEDTNSSKPPGQNSEETNDSPIPDDVPQRSEPVQVPDAQQEDKFSAAFPYIVAGGGALLLMFIALIASVLFYKRKVRNLETEIRGLTNEEVIDFFEGDKNINPEEAQALVLSMPFIKDFEIPRNQMILDPTKVLGTGQFGTVIHGFIQKNEKEPMMSVAMKTVKENVDVASFKAFLSEVKIMAYLGRHENIVGLLGTCTANIKDREIFIALEFCPLGNLGDFLKKNRINFEPSHNSDNANATPNTFTLEVVPNNTRRSFWRKSTDITTASASIQNPNKITTLDLLTWTQAISNAMIYLTQMKVIHGDLATRNILLTGDRVAKISDFGLSRQVLNYANYMKTSQTPVPWRWLSIEAMKQMQFSTASDVWAFGVTMWEIFSLAEVPYGAWTYDLFFADRLIAGDRLPIPQQADVHIYDLMNSCWMLEPTQRPDFQQIHDRLGAFMSKLKPGNPEI